MGGKSGSGVRTPQMIADYLRGAAGARASGGANAISHSEAASPKRSGRHLARCGTLDLSVDGEKPGFAIMGGETLERAEVFLKLVTRAEEAAIVQKAIL